jgi:hypothetical protein
MSFTISTKKETTCKKHKFCIYHHHLSMEDLDKYIIEIMFDENKLNQLFQPFTNFNSEDRIFQLKRFIDNSFLNRESEVSDSEIETTIKNNTNKSYYSFFAEALLARLSIDYIDNKLITGVISVDDNVEAVGTGADVCMFSDENLVIGEAKFYGVLAGGVTSIIEDSSFESKLKSYIKKLTSMKEKIVLKDIEGNINEKTQDEIKKIPLIFTGFILHTKNKNDDYETYYNKISTSTITNFPDHYNLHLYHLPIKLKNELIFKVQRQALDFIIKLKSTF